MSAGVMKRQADELEDPPCRTYTLNGLLHLDCSNRGLKDLPEELDYTVGYTGFDNHKLSY